MKLPRISLWVFWHSNAPNYRVEDDVALQVLCTQSGYHLKPNQSSFHSNSFTLWYQKKKHKMLSCLSSQSPSVTLTGSIRNYLPSSFLILSLLWWCWVHKSWITIVPTCSNQEKGICLSIYPFSQMNIVLVLPLHSCAKWWWSRWLKCFVGSGRTTRKEGVKYV